mmetsp:Transcript_29344/g.60001  ORF Transcript_29344/g.60001 Transcript_29344/m.60001 type:complete len:270 (+) Transcript_29344:234-1043(+)
MRPTPPPSPPPLPVTVTLPTRAPPLPCDNPSLLAGKTPPPAEESSERASCARRTASPRRSAASAPLRISSRCRMRDRAAPPDLDRSTTEKVALVLRSFASAKDSASAHSCVFLPGLETERGRRDAMVFPTAFAFQAMASVLAALSAGRKSAASRASALGADTKGPAGANSPSTEECSSPPKLADLRGGFLAEGGAAALPTALRALISLSYSSTCACRVSIASFRTRFSSFSVSTSLANLAFLSGDLLAVVVWWSMVWANNCSNSERRAF